MKDFVVTDISITFTWYRPKIGWKNGLYHVTIQNRKFHFQVNDPNMLCHICYHCILYQHHHQKVLMNRIILHRDDQEKHDHRHYLGR